MPITVSTSVSELSLDLTNFRTVPQPDEISAIQAMITISPDYFWGLMDSLLADEGYLPTENILVLDMGGSPKQLIVKEGNRRVAALKMILGYIPLGTISIPSSLELRIKSISPTWVAANQAIPCAIYQKSESAVVDRIVTLAHGKGDKASRNKWNAVARARHSRDVLNVNQPALDILEKYVATGTNLTSDQAKRWAGEYPLTVLDEAIKKLAPRLGFTNSPELAKQYPAISYRDEFNTILLNIGLENIKFGTLRNSDVATKYGIPPITPSGGSSGSGGGNGSSSGGSSGAGGTSGGNSGSGGAAGGGTNGGNSGSGGAAGGGTNGGNSGTTGPGKQRAVSISDPRSVKIALRKFKPLGNNREKVVSLRNEACSLDIEQNPMAFCFILRSMFEISAKAYCDDHKASGGPSATKSDRSEKRLSVLLDEIYKYMITLPTGKPDQAMQKQLHGAVVELTKPESVLSVTSMNQLVHNPKFSVRAGDISAMFGNIFPLLEAMNK